MNVGNTKKTAAKRLLAFVLVFGLVFTNQGLLTSMSASAEESTLGVDAVVENREVRSLSGEGWKFNWKGSDLTDLSSPNDTSQWESVTVPHCWNAEDGADGGSNYKRGVGWYEKIITVSEADLAKNVFLKCYGASQEAKVYVNGTLMGNGAGHPGGYTQFCLDITDQLVEGENQIIIRVDNTNGGTTNTTIAPIVGDFTVFGGLYRNVELILTAPVYMDMVGEESEDGYDTSTGSGIQLATSNVSESSAALTVNTKIVNSSSEAKTVTVKAILREQNWEELDWLEDYADLQNSLSFQPEDMGNGADVKIVEKDCTLEANSSQEVSLEMVVENPHLWNGKEDPFRYETEVQIKMDEEVIDSVSDYVGFRYFDVTRDGGFTLNGETYPLRGVSRHQDVEGKGYAVSKEDMAKDFSILYEIGANSVRLAHYPHDSYFYDLCDQFGLTVWAEIPFIGGHNDTPAGDEANVIMEKTTRQQLRELILQQFNHPSIIFWGLENEVGHQASYGLATDWITKLNDLAHELDPSRKTTMATNVNAANSWSADVIAWNTYPGWYNGSIDGGLGSSMDSKASGISRPVGISEYGAGGNPYQHTEQSANSIAELGGNGGNFHPEEFQNALHEEAVKDISSRPWLWCTYVWNLFDFGSDSRAEGDNPGINDKGLVTYDRSLKKDSFYLYKANWNKEDPFVYITSRRFEHRERTTLDQIKVYSNLDSVNLTVDGNDMGAGKSLGNGIFVWEDVSFKDTAVGTVMEVTATGMSQDGECTDTVIWDVAENAKVTEPESISQGKPIISSSDESGNGKEKAVDGDVDTRWTAGNSFTGQGPYYITVDLGKSYHLTSFDIPWFNSATSRSYQYEILVSENGKDFVQVVDKLDNTQEDRTKDILDESVMARYVKVNVTGCSLNGNYNASLWELWVHGWRLSSEVCGIDLDNHVIQIPESIFGENQKLPATVEQYLTIEGDCSIQWEMESYFFTSNDKMHLRDHTGAYEEFDVEIIEGESDLSSGDIDTTPDISGAVKLAIDTETIQVPSSETNNSYGDGGGVAALTDGNENPVWHTAYYNGTEANRPIIGSSDGNLRNLIGNNEIILPLEKSADVVGLRYYSKSGNGAITKYEIYTSKDGVNYEDFPAVAGSWENTAGWKEAIFTAVMENVACVKLVVKQSISAESDHAFISGREIELIGFLLCECVLEDLAVETDVEDNSIDLAGAESKTVTLMPTVTSEKCEKHIASEISYTYTVKEAGTTEAAISGNKVTVRKEGTAVITVTATLEETSINKDISLTVTNTSEGSDSEGTGSEGSDSEGTGSEGTDAEITAAKTELYDLLGQYRIEDQGKYTTESWNQFVKVYQESMSVWESETATVQEIETALANMQKALGELKVAEQKSDTEETVKLTLAAPSIKSVELKAYNNGVYAVITVNAVSGAGKYKIYRVVKGVSVLVGTTEAGGLSIQDKNLDATSGSYYAVAVSADDKVESPKGTETAFKTTKAAKIRTVKKMGSGIKLTWKKVKNAKEYIIYRSSSKNGIYTKIKNIKKAKTISYVDKKAKKGKSYYYKIVVVKGSETSLMSSPSKKIKR